MSEIITTEKRWGVAYRKSGKLTGFPMFPRRFGALEYISKKLLKSDNYKAIPVQVIYKKITNIKS